MCMDKLEKNFSTFFLNSNDIGNDIDISFKYTNEEKIEIINQDEYNMLISIKNAWKKYHIHILL